MKRRRFIKQLSAVPLIPILGMHERSGVCREESATGDTSFGFRTTALATATSVATPLQIASDKRLFIDEHLIEKSENVTLTINPPLKTGEHNIVSEHPWEDFYVGGWNTDGTSTLALESPSVGCSGGEKHTELGSHWSSDQGI